LLGFIFRSPLRAAIVCGLLVAIGFGFASFPNPEVSKSVSDWRLEDVILSDADQQRVLTASESARGGDGQLVELTEQEFRELDLAYKVSLPDVVGSARRFVIQYAGMDDLDSGRVYVAQREVFAAPWWSPHRFIYKAASAEVDAFREVFDLTFERDVLGLTGLIVFDAFIGAVYGLVVGMIVAVIRNTGLAPAPTRTASSQRRRPSGAGAP
jgi:hypothetical protein